MRLDWYSEGNVVCLKLSVNVFSALGRLVEDNAIHSFSRMYHSEIDLFRICCLTLTPPLLRIFLLLPYPIEV